MVRDGVPTWSGEANLFAQYEEAALFVVGAVTDVGEAVHRRAKAGPRIVGRR